MINGMHPVDITLEDVRELRACADALQHENEKHYGKLGLAKLRAYSDRTKAVADKIEAKLKL